MDVQSKLDGKLNNWNHKYLESVKIHEQSNNLRYYFFA